MSAAIAFITGDPDLPQDAQDLVLKYSKVKPTKTERDAQRRQLVAELIQMLGELVPRQSERDENTRQAKLIRGKCHFINPTKMINLVPVARRRVWELIPIRRAQRWHMSA
jgi:hypothetical protein